MKSLMTPEIFFEKLIKLYSDSRESIFPAENIYRGRNVSISGYLEDLFAKFIATNNPKKEFDYLIDQPMSFPSSNLDKQVTKYPDIVIQSQQDGVITHLIDMKTDLGWNRNGMLEFCNEWEGIIESSKNKETNFKDGKTKVEKKGKFSKNLHLHIVVASRINSGKTIWEHYKEIETSLKNVSIYILSDKVHPNNYEMSDKDILNKIEIRHHEFKRFLDKISE